MNTEGEAYTEDQLQEILRKVWSHELSADEAWEFIDYTREAPDVHSKEYWIPIKIERGEE